MRSRAPLVAALLALLQTASAVAIARQDVADPDVFWVAAAGREMLATGAVPRVNGWSFVDGAHPWVMHEWLYGPVYALGLERFGPAFFLAVGILAAAATFALVTAALLADAPRRDLALAVALVVAYVCASRVGFARPTWSSLVFPAAMTLVAFRERFDRRLAALAVALALVWTNAHGSFPLGWIILAAALVERPSRVRGVALAGAVLASVLNPYGLGLHRLVLGYATASGGGIAVTHARVLEFAPIWRAEYHAITPVLLVAANALAAVAALVLVARRRHVVRAALVLLLCAAGVVASRHAALSPLLAPMILAPALNDLVRANRANQANEANEASRPRSHARWLAAIYLLPALVGLVVLVVRARAAAPDALLSPATGGADVMRLVRAAPPGAKIFAPFRSAGLVIWEGAPRGIRVFSDSRNDCYSGEVAEWFSSTHEMMPEQVLAGFDRYGVEMVLVPSVAHVTGEDFDVRWKKLLPLATAPASSATWEIRERSDGWLLYARSDARSETRPDARPDAR